MRGIYSIILGCAVFLLGGFLAYEYFSAEERVLSSQEVVPVSAATVKETQEKRLEERVDIYTPVIEQWQLSNHFTSAETLKNMGVGAGNCYYCHSADYHYSNETSKAGHNGVTCVSCHIMTVQRFTLADSDRVKLCTKCHSGALGGKGEFFFKHGTQGLIYQGIGALKVSDTSNAQFEKGLACSDCHMPNQNHDMKAVTPQKAKEINRSTICFMCHKEEARDSFSKRIADLQSEIETKTTKLIEEFTEIRKLLDKPENQKTLASVEEDLNVVEHNLALVYADKSKGIHNYKYVSLILADSEERLIRLKTIIKE